MRLKREHPKRKMQYFSLKYYPFLIILGLTLLCFNLEAQVKFETEFFEIEYTKNKEFIWNDKGSGGADKDISIMRPKASKGFFILGDMVGNRGNDEKKEEYYSIALKPKSGYEDLLKAPKSYKWVWDDSGTGADNDCGIWELVCPKGYVALGMIATKGNDPEMPKKRKDCKCVKKTAIFEGKPKRIVKEAYYISDIKTGVKGFWNDKDTGSDDDVSIFKTGYKKDLRVPPNTLLLTPNTFFAGEESEKFPKNIPYTLMIFDKSGDKAPPIIKPNLPKLNSTEAPTNSISQPVSYQIPFFMVQDDEYPSAIAQAEKSPFYTVKRSTYYTPVTTILATADDTQLTWSVEKSNENSTDYSNSLGLELTSSITVGAEG